MYGFGDEREPDETSLSLLESYVEEFMANLVSRAYNRSLKGGYSKLRISDIMHEVKNDEKMFMRAYKLLTTLDSVEKARRRQGGDNIMDLAGYAEHGEPRPGEVAADPAKSEKPIAPPKPKKKKTASNPSKAQNAL